MRYHTANLLLAQFSHLPPPLQLLHGQEKPDCLASSRRCSRSSRTPNRRRNISAFAFKESKSASAVIMFAFTIRSCGYTRQMTRPFSPFRRSFLVFEPFWRLVGYPVDTPWIPRGYNP